jgi:hypothetical protein
MEEIVLENGGASSDIISHYVYLVLRFLNNPLKAYKQAETMRWVKNSSNSPSL